jgi:hypothetical protein
MFGAVGKDRPVIVNIFVSDQCIFRSLKYLKGEIEVIDSGYARHIALVQRVSRIAILEVLLALGQRFRLVGNLAV